MKQRDFTSARAKEALLKDKEGVMKDGKPDPVRIKEINAALKDRSGKKAEKLVFKYLLDLW